MRHVLSILSLLCCLLPASAQDGVPRIDVKVSISPKTAKPGDVVTLTIDGDVHPEYHVYGSLEQTGVVPSFKTDKPALVALAPKGALVVPPGDLHVKPELPDLQEFWLTGKVQFVQKFTVRKDAPNGKLDVTGGLTYMACTSQFCDPEYTESIAAELTITGGSDAPKTAPKQAKKQDKPTKLSHQGIQQRLTIKLVPETARPGEPVRVEVHVNVDPGWHNYGSEQDPELGEPVQMQVKNKDLTADGEASVPGGKEKVLQDIGTYYLLKGDWVMHQMVRVPKDAKPGTLPVETWVRYTVCNDSTCLDPEETTLVAPLTIEAGAARADNGSGGKLEVIKGGPGKTGPPTKGDPAKDGKKKFVELSDAMFDGGKSADELGLWLYLLGAVGAGLFALIMPCTYPMIPLTISFFTKQAEMKGGRPIFLALAYGGGIIMSYVILGGLVGGFMQNVAADPWVNLVIGLMFVFFACSLFGMVELRPPQFLMNQATKAQMSAAKSTSGLGSVVPVFMMGMLLCVTSFACTAPFLGSMIAAGAQPGEGYHLIGPIVLSPRLLLGMAVFGVTMALPFVILSLVPGRLPRGGNWMNTAKVLFGFVELAAALKFFSNAEFAWNMLILPREMFLLIWGVLFAVAGIYMLGFIKLKDETGEIGAGRMLTGSVVLIMAASFLLGSNGYKFDNIVMTAFEPPYPEEPAHKVVDDDFDKAVEVAKTADKLLLVNFTGKT